MAVTRTAKVRAVAIVAALATACAWLALPGGGAAPAHVDDGRLGKIAGMGVAPPDNAPPEAMAAEFNRLHSDGLNTVSIDVWWDLDGVHANRMHPGELTQPDPALDALILAAHTAHLGVILTPKLWCPACLATNHFTWRGMIRPSDPHLWFANYRSFIDHYAQLAQRDGVWLFYVGSEYDSLQVDQFANEWRAVAAESRRFFSGFQAYEANYGNWPSVHFWDAVDIVGISAYQPLNDDPDPSFDTLMAGWQSSQDSRFSGRQWFNEMATLAAQTRKPLLFGEAGYHSSTYAGRAGADAKGGPQADFALQANLYRALLQTFEGQPWWLGVVWWEWRLSSGQSNSDTEYTPRGKAAESLLKAWYANGWRPGDPGGPPGGTGPSSVVPAAATNPA